MSGIAAILPLAETQFIDTNGQPLAGGSVFFYVPGTTTLKTTWADPAFSTANPNPVVLDAAGRAVIYGSGAYRQQVFDAMDNLIWDQVTGTPTFIQCGVAQTDSAGSVVVTFPFPFQECTSVVCTVGGSNSSPNSFLLEVSAPLSPTLFGVASSNVGGGFAPDIGFFWIACGN